MAKILGFYDGKQDTHWFPGGQYDTNKINNIPDPAGGQSEITSIPSPFARMDLVRSAFEYVAENDLDGRTEYHKLVSQALDLGQLLFNFDYLQDRKRFEIISWSPQDEIQALQNSNNKNHQILGNTLDLYFQQDQLAFNFDKVHRLFLVLYNNEVIGGTSPATLFFTKPDQIQGLNNIRFNNHDLFSDTPCPLYQRQPEYIEYLYSVYVNNQTLFTQNRNNQLPNPLRSLSDYFHATKDKLQTYNQELFDKLQNMQAGHTLQEVKKLATSIGPNDYVEVMGIPLQKKNTDIDNIESDFKIKLDEGRYTDDKAPLVLSAEFSDPIKYTRDSKWDPSVIQPPKYESTPLHERYLPGLGAIQYPWLTVSDFLEPYLISVFYPIDKKHFFDGNVKLANDSYRGFLLPLKPRFFQFFNPERLLKKMPDGEPMFEMEEEESGNVNVTLRIPIQKDGYYITFIRQYKQPQSSSEYETPDEPNNKGAIVDECSLGLSIFPFYQAGDQVESHHYRVMTLDRDMDHEYDISFLDKQANNAGTVTCQLRSDKHNQGHGRVPTTKFYILEKEFDLLQVQLNTDKKAIIFPRFNQISQNTNKTFHFAVDFGTTNTHIEYAESTSSGERLTPEPLNFGSATNDIQYANLYDPEYVEYLVEAGGLYLREQVLQELLPEEIGNASEFNLPQRTAIAESPHLNVDQPVFALADTNIPFTYEKRINSAGNSISTNLKWAEIAEDGVRSRHNKMRTRTYLDKILFLLRNKVLLNNGKLDNTKLIWFYPTSMLQNRLGFLEREWNSLYEKYFPNVEVKKIPESLAPFYYFKNNEQVSAKEIPVVSVDIGGETTDIVIYQNDEPQYLTSIRFAANAIFGDGLGGTPENNGFFQKYNEEIKNILEQNGERQLRGVQDQIVQKQNSNDIISFYFSLHENKRIKDKKLDLSFIDKLHEDNQLKIVFVLFYGALMYHIAKLMNTKGLEMPSQILFSGNGSRVLQVIDQSDNFDLLLPFTQLIFKKIAQKGKNGQDEANGNAYKPRKIRQAKFPKEVTCKGGILGFEELDNIDINIENLQSVLVGNERDETAEEAGYTYQMLENDDTVHQELFEGVSNEVCRFVEFFFELNEEYNFKRNLGIDMSSVQLYKDLLTTDLKEPLKALYDKKIQELEGNLNVRLEEPLFFYPFSQTLNHLAYRIVENDKQKQENSQ